MAIRDDDTLVVWGVNNSHQLDVPEVVLQNKVRAVSAGWRHCLVILKSNDASLDETVVSWGGDPDGTDPYGLNPPNFPVRLVGVKCSAIAAGEHFNVVIKKSDGSLDAWGQAGTCGDACTNCQGVTVPGWSPINVADAGPGPFIDISSSGHFSVAKHLDGTLRAWGADEQYMCQVTNLFTGMVRRFSAGHRHGLAIDDWDQQNLVHAWGANHWGQGTTDGIGCAPAGGPLCGNPCLPTCYWEPPEPFPTDVIDICGGYYHCTAMRADGTLFGWGKNLNRQCEPPAGSFVAFSSKYDHGVAIEPPPTALASYANFDRSPNLPLRTASDLSAFVAALAAGAPRADCDGNRVVNPGDLTCFLERFNAYHP